MNEPDISPLAKRLAEENNVRWQELTGSGAGGKVVERDVLEYLARVMAGEEALDPTPEPLPDGMEAWPEEDVAVWKRDQGGLDDLQAELSASERVDDAPAIVEPAAESDAGDLISEDIFLFDEGGPDDELEAVGNTFEDDGLLIAGDDDFAAPTPAADADPVAFDDEDLDFTASDDALEIDDDLPDLFAASDDDDADDEALFDGGDDPIGVLVSDDSEPDDVAVSAGALDSDPMTGEGDADELDDDLVGVEAAGLELPEDELDLAPEDLHDDASEARFDDGVALESDAPPAVDGAAAEHDAAEPIDAEPIDAEPIDAVVETVAADTESDGAADAETDDAAYDAADAELGAAVAVPVAAEVLADLPVVSHGALLRRHVDLTALAAAQLAVAKELGHDDPVAPTPFLVRAAAKALRSVPLTDGDLGIATFDDGLSVGTLDEAATMPFAELVGAVGEPDEGDDALALVVADMSELAIDEAVLHLDAPVLVLGRILYDSQQGSYRSTLSLAGDIAPDLGGRLLARVAELLDAPVQLVL